MIPTIITIITYHPKYPIPSSSVGVEEMLVVGELFTGGVYTRGFSFFAIIVRTWE